MTALATLALCALLPWAACRALDARRRASQPRTEAAVDRSLRRRRKIVLRSSVIILPAAAVSGALFVDPALSTRWPTAGSWFFASLCAAVSWCVIALAQRTEEERKAMSWLETIGRVSQMMAVPSLGVGLSLVADSAARAWVPAPPAAQAVLTAFVSVLGLVVVSPWLAMQLGLWRILPISIESGGRAWRVAHLPAPAPFLTHAAALPWLRTVLVTDGLFRRAPDPHWRALVRYEIGGERRSRADRAFRWLVSAPLSLVVFIGAGAAAGGDPRKLVAGTVLAVAFTGVATWNANRQPESALRLSSEEPSMQELAQTLRSLPPRFGQALPRTAHRPLGTALYDRLFALGHDPGHRRDR